MGDRRVAMREWVGTRGRVLAVAIVCLLAAFAAPRTVRAAEDTVTVHRLVNHYLQDKHLYTSSLRERNDLVSLGWTYEGVGWVAPRASGEPIYRLYNPWTHEHFYTTDRGEYDRLDAGGWKGEGETFRAATTGVAVHRLYNPYVERTSPSSHHFTTSEVERDDLVKLGWNYEGVAWYGQEDAGERPLVLGSFFVDTEPVLSPYGAVTDFETILAVTRDGYEFTKVSTPFTNEENPFHDPSIMYKDGWFYLLSNWNLQDGRFHPMISYSQDLVTWSEPEGGVLINEGDEEPYAGIPLESPPFGIEGFDVVAPEWFVDDDGSVYILFSAGYFGYNHGEPENDRMVPYAVKVDISHEGFTPWTAPRSGKPFPQGLRLDFSEAFEIRGLDRSDEYIDGSMYKEDGVYYLLIKKDGFINQVYRNRTLGPTGWELVNDEIALGNEGPTLLRLDGDYLLYTDMIGSFPGHGGRTGIQVCSTEDLGRAFSASIDVASDVPLRHGTVLPLDGEARATCERWLAGR